MKINKLIAKGLSIGLLLNSLSILSYANTEIPNRYQTLEGEHITIDDSMEGNLEEIEIFGNTVQDENNLEDIQSVGDLYVDENGNPILDKQGREQYKLTISSSNKNLLDEELLNGSTQNRLYFSVKGIQKNTTYKISSGDLNILNGHIGIYDNNDLSNELLRVSYYGELKTTFNSSDLNGDYTILFHGVDNRDKFLNGGWIQLEEGINITSYSHHQKSSIKLLLPTQLQKVGDVADRLYYDKTKKAWLIEKNIKEITLNGDENWSLDHMSNPSMIRIYLNIPDILGSKHIISNKLPTLDITNWNKELEGVRSVGDAINIQKFKNNLSEGNLNGFKDWLSRNNILVKYQLKVPEKIILPQSTQIVLNSFFGTTYVFTEMENGINPALKVTVDRLPQIAKNSVEEAKINSSINNIALARMYTNMLPESLYKDQLQEQLSEIFSSDMVLDKKNVTSNLDLYIKCENILMMSLSTNNITFEDFSGVEDMIKENAVQISINSSLPYSLNAYLPTEIQNSDKSNTMNKDILNIKENSETAYQTFNNTTDKIILKDNCSSGNNLIHGIDIKLKGGIAHQKDVYKTTIKFEAEQK